MATSWLARANGLARTSLLVCTCKPICRWEQNGSQEQICKGEPCRHLSCCCSQYCVRLVHIPTTATPTMAAPTTAALPMATPPTVHGYPDHGYQHALEASFVGSQPGRARGRSELTSSENAISNSGSVLARRSWKVALLVRANEVDDANEIDDANGIGRTN